MEHGVWSIKAQRNEEIAAAGIPLSAYLASQATRGVIKVPNVDVNARKGKPETDD